MPKGPNGEKRPADVIGAAVLVGRIATGEVEDAKDNSERARVGSRGGVARLNALSPARRSEIARAGGRARQAARPAPSEEESS